MRQTGNMGLRGPSHFAALFALLLFFCLPATAAPASRVWEGKIELPTYALGEEDPNPPFPLLHGSHVYPYTMLDDLTDRRETKSYTAVFLENETLKATILPSLGGRLYSLYDKVSGREVFYRNNVVKYGLVGLRGAWISGGVEFNFPDGHTVVTVSPVAWTAHSNADGSATVVVGDIDRVTGMHWEVALTLRPGEARLEQRVTLFNPTPLPQRYWYWANAAVPASDDMQFVYPMREAYPHARWPVFTFPEYRGVDYSWYKNVRQPTSLFARQVHRDFFGAYYHAADYGVVHVADFREVPGKKTWTWGVADNGLIWTGLLTDHDGPYNEIQAGRYETQLNYEFMPPHHVESWTEYWYPVRGLGGGFAAAGRDLALNVRYGPGSDASGPHVELVVCPTAHLEGVVIRARLGGQALAEFRPPSLEPLIPAKFDVPVADLGVAKTKLMVDVEARGKTLLHWSAADPVDDNPDFVPASTAPEPHPPDPAKMAVEELFRYGVGQEKDGHDLAAHATFERVLERDSGYVPALVKLAWWDYRAVDFPGAEQAIARALVRAGDDPEVHYAAGVLYRAAGRLTLARDAFWASIHFGGPAERALVELGEIEIADKDYARAAELLRRALDYGSDDALAFADLAAALRLDGKVNEASQAADRARALMPLLPFADAEAGRFGQVNSAQARAEAPSQAGSLGGIHAPDEQDALEVAAWYRRLGDYPSADAVLEFAQGQVSPHSPLVENYLASDARVEGDAAKAAQFAAQAAAASHAKVFPQRVSDAVVLAEAVQQNPLDARAKCDLGNFLFAHSRYLDAAKLWLGALGEGFDDSVVERNLGVYAWRVTKDLKSAAAYYRKAIALAPAEYRLYVDLDDIYAEAGDTPSRQKLFAQAPAVVLDRDTVRVRRALLLVAERNYDQALAALTSHRFKPWEGGELVRRIYVLANLERGKAKLRELARDGAPSRQSAAREAERAFRRALEYPAELGVGKPDKPHDESAYYWLGEALESGGRNDEARQAWQQAVAESQTAGVFGAEPDAESEFYAALALEKLGRTSEAEATLDQLEARAGVENPKADQLYVAGLVARFRRHDDQARHNFQRALELDPSFWPARLEM